MFNPIYYNFSATVLRNTYVNDKSSYVATGNIYKGYLAPITEEDGLDLDKFGKQFNFSVKPSADIQEADILEIDGEKYNVKGVAPWKGIVVKYKKILLVKSKK